MWEQTVMRDEQIDKYNHYGDSVVAEDDWDIRELLKAQAELTWHARDAEIEEAYTIGFNDGQQYSFKANQAIDAIKEEAEKRGMRKVVEWMRRERNLCPVPEEQLKVWGIE